MTEHFLGNNIGQTAGWGDWGGPQNEQRGASWIPGKHFLCEQDVIICTVFRSTTVELSEIFTLAFTARFCSMNLTIKLRF